MNTVPIPTCLFACRFGRREARPDWKWLYVCLLAREGTWTGDIAALGGLCQRHFASPSVNRFLEEMQRKGLLAFRAAKTPRGFYRWQITPLQGEASTPLSIPSWLFTRRDLSPAWKWLYICLLREGTWTGGICAFRALAQDSCASSVSVNRLLELLQQKGLLTFHAAKMPSGRIHWQITPLQGDEEHN